ncbi:MAG: ribulokinase [Planctomycetota bacterium]|jgi:L-ribulokinase
MAPTALGFDFGTNSVRALLVDLTDGVEIGSGVHPYRHGEQGILLGGDPNLARQHPADYVEGAEQSARAAIDEAVGNRVGFDPNDVVGIGVTATGSTPLPVDGSNTPLALTPEFKDDLDAMAWLWKDHTAHAEAEEISKLASAMRPEVLAKCGGTYSSEWFFSKILHCLRTAPRVFDAARSWMEITDWIPAMLCDVRDPAKAVRSVCAAGHKAMYLPHRGLPDGDFLSQLDPKLGALRERLYERAHPVDVPAGELSVDWGRRLGLRPAIPVATGAIDAHLGAVGSGIRPGRLVKILGTSTCDMMVAPREASLPDIPGLCGIVPDSILPGYFGLEAGQSAVGDIFNWFVQVIRPGGVKALSHEMLTAGAAKLRPGESGLLALDWNNGNRTVLVDQRLTGLLLGQTLRTTPAEVYRAIIAATAFGALTIMNRVEAFGVEVQEVVNCGGIAEKNPLVLQIYADVTGRPMHVAKSPHTCALGVKPHTHTCTTSTRRFTTPSARGSGKATFLTS